MPDTGTDWEMSGWGAAQREEIRGGLGHVGCPAWRRKGQEVTSLPSAPPEKGKEAQKEVPASAPYNC